VSCHLLIRLNPANPCPGVTGWLLGRYRLVGCAPWRWSRPTIVNWRANRCDQHQPALELQRGLEAGGLSEAVAVHLDDLGLASDIPPSASSACADEWYMNVARAVLPIGRAFLSVPSGRRESPAPVGGAGQYVGV
jgi:hypothetical protein